MKDKMSQDERSTSGVTVAALTVEQSGRTLLDDVSFRLGASELCALVGPNGAGKTTLLRALLRALPLRGRVTLGERSLVTLPPRERARLVAYLPQHVEIPVGLTARQFIELGRHPWRSPWGALGKLDQRAIGDAIERTATQPFLDEAMEILSGGERQRVYIAAALAQNTPILLLDEPTAGLDPLQREELWRMLGVIRDEGRTVLVATHDIESARRWADRFLALRVGAVVFDGSPADFFRGERLTMTYLSGEAVGGFEAL